MATVLETAKKPVVYRNISDMVNSEPKDVWTVFHPYRVKVGSESYFTPSKTKAQAKTAVKQYIAQQVAAESFCDLIGFADMADAMRTSKEQPVGQSE